MKCPVCHTNLNYIPNIKVGRCICGNYVDNITEDTWKEERYLRIHEKWEAGEYGYNMIYERLNELYNKS